MAALGQLKLNLSDGAPFLKREERGRHSGGSLALAGSPPEAVDP